jgi:hypothetical protein
MIWHVLRMNNRRTPKNVVNMKLKEHQKCSPRSIWEQQAGKDAVGKVLSCIWGFGFDDRIYWTLMQLVITAHKSLSDTLSSFSTGHSRLLTTLHYSTTLLYSIVLLQFYLNYQWLNSDIWLTAFSSEFPII